MLLTRIQCISGITFSLLLTACGSDKDEHYAKVYKYDDSVQCAEGSIPLEDMRLELSKQGVDVICAQKAHDGMTRPTLCGLATGNINVYSIHKVNLPDAEKLGFKPASELSEYQDKACNS